MLAWAGRRLGRAWEEAAENQKEGRSWASVHQAGQELVMSQHSANPVSESREVPVGEPEPSFLPGMGVLAQLPSSQFTLGLPWGGEDA